MVQKSNLEIASSELQSKATFLGSKGDKKNGGVAHEHSSLY